MASARVCSLQQLPARLTSSLPCHTFRQRQNSERQNSVKTNLTSRKKVPFKLCHVERTCLSVQWLCTRSAHYRDYTVGLSRLPPDKKHKLCKEKKRKKTPQCELFTTRKQYESPNSKHKGFVAASILLSRQQTCFVATKMVLVAAPANDSVVCLSFYVSIKKNATDRSIR